MTENVSAQTEEHITTEYQDVPPIDEQKRQTSASKNNGMEDGSIKEILRDILEALQDSSIAGPTAAKDDRSRFWGKYKRVAEEHDSEILERYTSDMDIVLIFAGLFSAVSTSFIVAMEPSLLPDPADTTNALLLQIAQILGNSTTPRQVTVPTVPIFTGPLHMDVWVQTIAYLSLASSLLAAFGAVLGKQWLNYYKTHRYGRGTIEERGVSRQEKFDGLRTWYLEAVLQSFPLLIQFSLLLFGVALSGHMWSEQRTIASVIIATTAFGVLFYFLTLFASLLSPACPFQSPFSTVYRMLQRHIRIKLRDSYREMVQSYRQHWRGRLLLRTRQFLKAKLNTTKAFMRRCIRRLSHLRSGAADIEQGSGHSRSSPRKDAATIISLDLPDKTRAGFPAPALLWLLEISTDPEVLLAAARIVPEVEWHVDLDIDAAAWRLFFMFIPFFHEDTSLSPDEGNNALTYCRSSTHLFSEMYGNEREAVYLAAITQQSVIYLNNGNHLLKIFEIMFAPGISRSGNDGDDRVVKFLGIAPKRDVLQVLHMLPYLTFGFTEVEEYEQSSLKSLTLGVVTNILDAEDNLTHESPGVSDCAMVIARLLGLEFNLKDKRKLNKSLAFEKMLNSIYVQITAIFYEDQQNTWKSSLCKPDDNDSAKLKAHIAMDCLLFVFSLLTMVPHFWKLEFLPADAYLFICKVYFDKAVQEGDPNLEPFKRLGSNSVYLSHLQNSMRKTAKNLNRGGSRQRSGSPGIEQRLTVWNHNGWNNLKKAKDYYPWLLDYLEHLCTTPLHDISDLHDALLVSNYGLTDLQKSSAGILSYLKTITFCMGAENPDRLRRTALRAVCAKWDIFFPQVEQMPAEWDTVLAAFSLKILDIVYPDLPRKEEDNQTMAAITDLDDCIYRYVELIFTLAQENTWHERLIQHGHLKACIHLHMPQLMQTYPALGFLRISVALRIGISNAVHILSDLDEDAWRSIITDLWTALASQYALDGIYDLENQPWDFVKLLPDIKTLTLEHATSVDVVKSILVNIPATRDNIHRLLIDRKEDLQVAVFIFNDLQEKLEQHQLNRS